MCTINGQQYTTPLVESNDPHFDYKFCVDSRDEHMLQLHVVNEHDVHVGAVTVDTRPLNYGMQTVEGWYSIVNVRGVLMGQLKVKVESYDKTRDMSPTRYQHNKSPVREPQDHKLRESLNGLVKMQ